MIKCQACGAQNLDSSQYCDECGDSLKKYKAPDVSETYSKDSFKNETRNRENPIYKSANVTSLGVPPIEEKQPVIDDLGQEKPGGEKKTRESEARLKSTGIHANLVIERGGAMGTEFPLVSDESNIGRWDADNGIFPDVDLDSHDPEAKVSRKHARIILKDGYYLLEDLGSTNGTFVNRGRRLIPGNPHQIKEGDEIIVGKTFLRFHIGK